MIICTIKLGMMEVNSMKTPPFREVINVGYLCGSASSEKQKYFIRLH